MVYRARGRRAAASGCAGAVGALVRREDAMRAVVLAAVLVCLAGAAAWAQDGQATCKDVYQIYQTCFDGGAQMDLQGCGYLVDALGPRLMGEAGLSGFSAALSVGICKRGCEDGAKKNKAMGMNAFRKEFCGASLK